MREQATQQTSTDGKKYWLMPDGHEYYDPSFPVELQPIHAVDGRLRDVSTLKSVGYPFVEVTAGPHAISFKDGVRLPAPYAAGE